MKHSILASCALLTALAITPASHVVADEPAALGTHKDLNIFSTAFDASGLDALIESREPFTLFVPSNAALQDEGSASLLEEVYRTPSNEWRLVDLMGYHLVPDQKISLDTSIPAEAQMQSGDVLAIERANGEVTLNGHISVTRSFELGSGIVHVVSGLLWADLVDDRSDTQQLAELKAAR